MLTMLVTFTATLAMTFGIPGGSLIAMTMPFALVADILPALRKKGK